MTPEEHIEMAEKIIANYRNEADSIRASEVHVSIAFFKKQYPPDGGRPIRSSGRMHNHPEIIMCYSACPAFGTDSTNYPRPIPDNPQA